MNHNAVDDIKARLPIDEVVGTYVKLEKSGKSFKARCPFHNEKSASFFVSPDRGGYYCFGCNAKGDIFTFVEQFEGLDFKGALKVLAERAGVPLVYEDKGESDKDRLFKIMEDSAKFFEQELARNDTTEAGVASKSAREYLDKRGISEKTRQEFRIGWSQPAWRNLLAYLKKKGWKEDVIEKAGLVKKNEKGDVYDRFRGRVIFPITDSSGRVVAFTGRILIDDGESPKYLNSPDTPLYNKSQILFGLDKAKTEIRRLNYSILVEGQMDLVLSHQIGTKNTIAASGTALTDQAVGNTGAINNLGMVRRLSPNMIIALDSDSAGRAAAMRAVAATALSMGMSVKIADIEGGKDPADLILSDPELWKDVLKNAKHVVEFELGNVMRDAKDPRTIPKLLRERVFPYLVRIDSEMDKAFYVKIIAERTGLGEQAVWEDLRKTKIEAGSTKQGEMPSNSSTGALSSSSVLRTPPVIPMHRIDLVERRMFGLLALMDQAKLPQAETYRGQIKQIADSSYGERVQRIEPVVGDLSFEAISVYGDDSAKWDSHMKELIINFEEDMINEELLRTMREFKAAEKEGNTSQMEQLNKKYKALLLRRDEIKKAKK